MSALSPPFFLSHESVCHYWWNLNQILLARRLRSIISKCFPCVTQGQGKKAIEVCKVSTDNSWHREKNKNKKSYWVFAAISKSKSLWGSVTYWSLWFAINRLKRHIIFILPLTPQPCTSYRITSNSNLKRGRMENTWSILIHNNSGTLLGMESESFLILMKNCLYTLLGTVSDLWLYSFVLFSLAPSQANLVK